MKTAKEVAHASLTPDSRCAWLSRYAVPLFMFGDRVLAIQDSEDKVWFGPVGITPGERALVNIYAVGNPNDVGNPNEIPWTFVVQGIRHAG